MTILASGYACSNSSGNKWPGSSTSAFIATASARKSRLNRPNFEELTSCLPNHLSNSSRPYGLPAPIISSRNTTLIHCNIPFPSYFAAMASYMTHQPPILNTPTPTTTKNLQPSHSTPQPHRKLTSSNPIAMLASPTISTM